MSDQARLSNDLSFLDIAEERCLFSFALYEYAPGKLLRWDGLD